MARRFWPGQNPLGRRLAFWGDRKKVEVVGIVRNGKYRSLNEAPRCFMYLPYQQGALISLFHESGQVDRIEHVRGGVIMEGRIPGRLASQFAEWETDGHIPPEEEES